MARISGGMRSAGVTTGVLILACALGCIACGSYALSIVADGKLSPGLWAAYVSCNFNHRLFSTTVLISFKNLKIDIPREVLI